MAGRFLFFALLALMSTSVIASDSSSLQDFCVADLKSNVFVNGLVCKDPKFVTAKDFFYSGLDKPGDTSNAFGSNGTLLHAGIISGLNTLGISMTRNDCAPGGLVPPHTLPRATEISTVVEGQLYAGFVTSNPDNNFFSKVLNKEDVFVFPQGLIDFQINIAKTNAVAITALSSHNPGVNRLADAVFWSKPDHIPANILAKAFQIDQHIIEMIQSKF